MEKELTEQLLKWANEVIAVGKTQIPILVQQYLTWWKWVHIFWITLSGILCTVPYFIPWKKWWGSDSDYDTDDLELGTTIVICMVGAIMLVTLIANIYYLIKLNVAPAVYIIDSVAR